MREPKSRLDDLSNLILNVANKSSRRLELDNVPDSRLKIPGNFLQDVPDAFRNDAVEHSLAHGLDYFSPGKTALIMAGKNQVLPYIAAREIGPGGLVINCFRDNDDLKKLKSKFKELPAKPLANLQFHYTPNGDLRTRYDEIEKFLVNNPMKNAAAFLQLENYLADLRRNNPLISDGSVDIAVLDVPNININGEDPWDLFADVYRILKRGGVFLFSLQLSDEKAVDEGYLCEEDLAAFTTRNKFHGLQCIGRSDLPYKVINGREIRWFNFAAFKGKEGRCLERKQAVIYNGPWKEIKDDDGHTYPRGKRVAVCDKTFNVLLRPPYNGQFTYLRPYIDIPLEQACDFPCAGGILFRDPKETKGIANVGLTLQAQDDCGCGGGSDGSDSCC